MAAKPLKHRKTSRLKRIAARPLLQSRDTDRAAHGRDIFDAQSARTRPP